MVEDVRETNKAIAIRLFTDVFDRHDLDAADVHLAPDVVFHNAGKVIHGVGGWKAFAGEWIGGFPDTRMTVDFAMAEGDRVLIHWQAEGTHEGVFFGRPATGRRLVTSGLSLFRLSSGRIEEIWDQTEFLGEAQPFSIS